MDNKKAIRNLLIYLGIPIVLIVSIAIAFASTPKKEYTTSEIIYLFQDQKVKEYSLDFGTGELKITKTNGKKIETSVASISLFLEAIDDSVDEYNKNNDKPMKFTWKQATDNSWWLSLLPNLILIVLLGLVWWYFMRKLSGTMGDAGKSMNFGKAKFKDISDEKRKTTFADV
ncbi:MAG: ATP-dependent zinc metalloprotease FtsH, partial [Clostridia bacterium]|nr:ATP-dependent zinc metalloprotease FtsH [Clostridia bacterium]